MKDLLIERLLKNENVKQTNRKEGNIILIIDGGIGDTICSSVMINSARNLNPNKNIVVRTFYPEIFVNNPDIDYLYSATNIDNFFEEWIKNEKDYKSILKKDIYNLPIYNLIKYPTSKIYCDLYGFPFKKDNPKIYLNNEEINEAKRFCDSFDKEVVLIQPYAANHISNPSNQMTKNKDWFLDLWEELISKLADDYAIVQVGGKNEKELKGVSWSLVGSTSIRQTAALVHECKFFISIDSVIQHIGCAVNKKGIVLFGRSDPKTFGHNSNLNIYVEGSCTNLFCGRPQSYFGDYCFENGMVKPWECKKRSCMKAITPELVVKKIKENF